MSELMSLNIDDVLDQFKPGESQTLKSLARNTGLDCFTVRMVLRRLLHCRVVDIDYVGETRSRRVYHLTEIAKHPPVRGLYKKEEHDAEHGVFRTRRCVFCVQEDAETQPTAIHI